MNKYIMELTANNIKSSLIKKYCQNQLFHIAWADEFNFGYGLSKEDFVSYDFIHNLITTYEIKISRNDALSEISPKHKDYFYKKHEVALLLSNRFYFVCPEGLVRKEELDHLENIGLIYIYQSGQIKIVKPSKLDCKRKKSDEFLINQRFIKRLNNKIIKDQQRQEILYLFQELKNEVNAYNNPKIKRLINGIINEFII